MRKGSGNRRADNMEFEIPKGPQISMTVDVDEIIQIMLIGFLSLQENF